MKRKQAIAVLFVTLLILINVLPAFAVTWNNPSKRIGNGTAQSSSSIPNTSDISKTPASEPTIIKGESSFASTTSGADSNSFNPTTADGSNSSSNSTTADGSNNSFNPTTSDESSSSSDPAAPDQDSTQSNPEEGSSAGDTTELTTASNEQIFTATLVTDGEEPGIYGTWTNLPSNVSWISIQGSFGGQNFFEWNKAVWDPSLHMDENGTLSMLLFRAEDRPLSAYLSGAVNSLYVMLTYYTQDVSVSSEPIRFSHNRTPDIPQTPPPFSANFKMGWFSYSLVGHFTDFPANVAKVCNTYSWDGITYEYTNPDFPIQWNLSTLGDNDPKARKQLENQEIAQYYCEPMESFLSGQKDSFYMRLEITTENNQVYYSQPVYLSREERQPLPDHLTPRISFGFDMLESESRNDNGNSEDDEDYYAELVTYSHGQLQVTVPDTASPADIRTLLPDTVPVRIRLWDKNTKEKYTFADLDCPVKWKQIPAVSLTPGVPYVIEDIAEPLVISAGTDIKTALGTYTLQKPLTFQSRYDSDTINLTLNPVAASDQPHVVLKGYNRNLVDVAENDWLIGQPLSLAFWNKPSGAVSIMASVIADGKRTELFDLLDKREINHNQSHALYGYIDLLQPEEYPFYQYLDGQLDSFTIELDIKGGVYDGKQVSLPWPMVYEIPEEIPDPSGFEGEENNVGSNFEEIDDDYNNGGQRPNLPSDDTTAPSVTTTPPVHPESTETAPSTSLPESTSQRNPPEEVSTTEKTHSAKSDDPNNPSSSTAGTASPNKGNTSPTGPSTVHSGPLDLTEDKNELSIMNKADPTSPPHVSKDYLPENEPGSTSSHPLATSKKPASIDDGDAAADSQEPRNSGEDSTSLSSETSPKERNPSQSRTHANLLALAITAAIVGGGAAAACVISSGTSAGAAGRLISLLRKLIRK